MYAWWFESKIAQIPPSTTQTFNLSKSSLAIPGIEFFPIEQLLELPLLCAEIRSTIEKKVLQATISDKSKKLSAIRKENANAFLSDSDK